VAIVGTDVSAALRTLSRVRGGLPAPARRAVKRAVDPILAPVGSLAGAHPAAGEPARVALTFDDGPDPQATPAVLEALAAADVHATFFALIDRAEAHPDLVRRVVAEGHEVGLHGPDHRRMTTLDPRALGDDLRAARIRLEQIAGTPVHWFRPPFGSQSVRTYLAARRAGLLPVVWTAWGEDWVDQSPAQVADRVMAGLAAGGIVLLHDGLAGDPREPAQPDPLADVRGEIVARLAVRLTAAHLRATTVGDLVRSGRPRRTAWFRP
jgi:peptidoglycan/xylan/chitin deacetylase (PgdA/CDA1 family)